MACAIVDYAADGVWIELTYSFWIVSASGVQTVAVRVFIHAMLVLGLWLGLERTDFDVEPAPAGTERSRATPNHPDLAPSWGR